MILIDALKKALKFFPKKKAIICGTQHWTYQEFYNRLTRLAYALKSYGIDKDDKVAILHPNCHYFLEAYFGISQLGAVSVPINYRLSPQEIAFILHDSDSKILIADPLFQKQIDSIRDTNFGIERIIWTGEKHNITEPDNFHYEEILACTHDSPCQEPAITAENIAQIYYTSGTTGRAKGVMLSHKNVLTHALGTIAELQLTDNDVWIHVAPLFHLADAWATWAITLVGGTHVLVREFDPKIIFESIENESVTLTNLIPTMLTVMVNHPEVKKYDYSSLRLLLSGGAPIAPEVVQKVIKTFNCDYIQT